jgi:truncated hemoglobin YjbI
MSEGTKTLYERLGGYNAIAAVASDLLSRLRADPQLGRFWAHRGEDGVMREKQLLIDFLCASAGGPMYYRGRDMLLATEACASAIATGMCSSVMPPRPWRSSRFLRPNSAT